MKKLFRHVTGLVIFSFVACLFLPLLVRAGVISNKPILTTSWRDSGGTTKYEFFTNGYDSTLQPALIHFTEKVEYANGHTENSHTYWLVMSDTTYSCTAYRSYFYKSSSDDSFRHVKDYSIDNVSTVDSSFHYLSVFSYIENQSNMQEFQLQTLLPVIEMSDFNSAIDFIKQGDISKFIPVDGDTSDYTLDKSVGLVKNARWRHLESKDEYNKVLQNAMNSGTGTGDSGNANYSDIYTHYASFVQDKCSFATTSTTGVKIGGRYQLQYASRVGFTFAYNLPDLLEGIDNTKQYYKRFGSSKPYPVVNGTNFDANQNIQTLFVQAYQWNDSLPSIGTWKRSLIFKETKYWIDVRIIDTKNKTYGAWYAMDMKTNTAKEVVTDNGDIDSDVSSEDNAHGYTKEEGEGDTFKDAEDNAKEVDKSTRYDQKWYDDIKDNTKKSAPAFKTLLNMITGIPSMISTLFSWLPSWVLQLVSAFFAIIIVLALLRFVLGS